MERTGKAMCKGPSRTAVAAKEAVSECWQRASFVGQAFPLAIPWIGRRRACPTICPMLPALHLRALLVFRLHDERFHFPRIFESVRCLRSGVHVNTKRMHLFDRGSYIFRIQTAS